jgi:hypothetical protein
LLRRPGGSDGQILDIARISPTYFDVLGVRPMLGRTFLPDEDQAGRHVAILSYGYWQEVFAKDPEVIGAKMLISDQPYTIVGVMPQNFVEPKPHASALWTTFAMYFEGNAAPGPRRGIGRSCWAFEAGTEHGAGDC